MATITKSVTVQRAWGKTGSAQASAPDTVESIEIDSGTDLGGLINDLDEVQGEYSLVKYDQDEVSYDVLITDGNKELFDIVFDSDGELIEGPGAAPGEQDPLEEYFTRMGLVK